MLMWLMLVFIGSVETHIVASRIVHFIYNLGVKISEVSFGYIIGKTP